MTDFGYIALAHRRCRRSGTRASPLAGGVMSMPSRSTAMRGRLAYVGIATVFSVVALGTSADATSIHGSAPAAPTGMLAVAVHTHGTPAPAPAPTVEQTVHWNLPATWSGSLDRLGH